MMLAFVATLAAARAQESPEPAATPVPMATAAPDHPTFMDRQYDGATHLTVAPYIWLPTLKQNLQFSAPARQSVAGAAPPIQTTLQVGPSDYVSKLNSAAMFAFDLRKGNVDLFGDYIYTNISNTSTINTVFSGPGGRVRIPVSIAASGRVAASIWEIAAGFTVAHGHQADLSAFAGWRQFPLNVSVGYSATVGKRGLIVPSGTFSSNDLANDVIFGLRGKAFFGDHVFIPYYADAGVGAINQTWEAYTGLGYAFNHGQTLLATYRSLNYNTFPANSTIQKLTLNGPMVGYTLQL
ncbi:MAG TPA: hypothetical protein VGF86_09240 [Candidatus Tumulicola sp.]